VLRIGRADRGSPRRQRDRTRRDARLRYFDDRDLTGFVDGTENPTDQERISSTIVGVEDPDFAGGSYVMVQKYLHDLAAWHGLSTETQEGIIGRGKLADIELDDAHKPAFAHNAVTKLVEDGVEVKILRHNMPFGHVTRGDRARTSSATRGRCSRSKRCSRTWSLAGRRAPTIAC
jgi:Dyp-type peroxidase family